MDYAGLPGFPIDSPQMVMLENGVVHIPSMDRIINTRIGAKYHLTSAGPFSTDCGVDPITGMQMWDASPLKENADLAHLLYLFCELAQDGLMAEMFKPRFEFRGRGRRSIENSSMGANRSAAIMAPTDLPDDPVSSAHRLTEVCRAEDSPLRPCVKPEAQLSHDERLEQLEPAMLQHGFHPGSAAMTPLKASAASMRKARSSGRVRRASSEPLSSRPNRRLQRVPSLWHKPASWIEQDLQAANSRYPIWPHRYPKGSSAYIEVYLRIINKAPAR